MESDLVKMPGGWATGYFSFSGQASQARAWRLGWQAKALDAASEIFRTILEKRRERENRPQAGKEALETRCFWRFVKIHDLF